MGRKMADTTTTAAKPEAKTEAKTEAKAEAKDAAAPDAASGKASDSSASDAPKGYSRGENQKLVTDAYRNNWDSIFANKPRRGSKQ
jgi:hypothetical protein